MDKQTIVRIGANVRTFRKIKGLRQKDLGEIVGKSKPWVCYIEKGKNAGRSLTSKMLENLAVALEVHVSDLLIGPYSDCPACLFPVREYWHYCGNCGERLHAKCNKCLTWVLRGQKYCDQCGRDMAEPANIITVEDILGARYTPPEDVDGNGR